MSVGNKHIFLLVRGFVFSLYTISVISRAGEHKKQERSCPEMKCLTCTIRSRLFVLFLINYWNKSSIH